MAFLLDGIIYKVWLSADTILEGIWGLTQAINTKAGKSFWSVEAGWSHRYTTRSCSISMVKPTTNNIFPFLFTSMRAGPKQSTISLILNS